MGRITVGLDFGTHQTKVCIEDKSDAKNPIYSFFAFNDLNGNKSVILPSIVQINKDDTLSYGFVDKTKCKYGKKFVIGEMPEYPKRNKLAEEEDLPKPPIPTIFAAKVPQNKNKLIKFKQNLEKAKGSYDKQMTKWEQRKKEQEDNRKRLILERKETYQNELRKWYRWQNSSQMDYRMVYRYFKQSTFSDYEWNCEQSSLNLSMWFLSYVIFHLEKKYGNDISIQMGIPTGSEDFEAKKHKAVSLLLGAYHLVEDVFQNDLDRFLATPVHELEKLTTFPAYSEEKKVEFGLQVFPEAYASLKSLTAQKKIENSSMSLMVDIGGGTTDITFFVVVNDELKIYDYSSIPFGLNFISETALPDQKDKFEVNVGLYEIASEPLDYAIKQYYLNLVCACDILAGKLKRSFEKTGFPMFRLKDALKDRIIIYSGGGSTYPQLRKPLLSFTDIRHMNQKIWEGMTINEISHYVLLCPILSTSLGLSIREKNDNVELSTTEDIFTHLVGQYYVEEKPRPPWIK